MSDRRRTSSVALHESVKMSKDTDLAENFLEALDAIYAEELTEDMRSKRLAATYKGYKIYAYEDSYDGNRIHNGKRMPYLTKYCVENDRGRIEFTGCNSVKECEADIDGMLREKDYEKKKAEAKKRAGDTVEEYRGFKIRCKDVIDADANPPEYSYDISATTRLGSNLVDMIKDNRFYSVADAKKAIDDEIREWNSGADDSTRYEESLKRLIIEALEILDGTALTEDYDDSHLETTYKGYKIYSYSKANDPGHRDHKNIHDPYSKKYRYEDDRGHGMGGYFSLEDCKEAIDTVIREDAYEDRKSKAEKSVDTVAEAYRGFEIYYKAVVDANAEPCKYSYGIRTTRKSGAYFGDKFENDSFRSVADAKSAIDDEIFEYNCYSDDKSRYKESLKRLFREALKHVSKYN